MQVQPVPALVHGRSWMSWDVRKVLSSAVACNGRAENVIKANLGTTNILREGWSIHSHARLSLADIQGLAMCGSLPHDDIP